MSIGSGFFRNGRDRGQSLVETALFLPILIILIAGVVEVSNLLVTQNKILTASRMAAGFGAANYVRSNWTADDSTADAMGDVALNTVTETLELSPDLWEVYSIRALTNASGTDFVEFESKHAYGNNNVVSAAEWSTIEATVRSDMLADLQSTSAIAGNVEVVASVPFHNIDDILGIPIWQWTGLYRLQGMTVMRVRPEQDVAACPILPIAVRLQQFSIYPTNWDPDTLEPDSLEPIDGAVPLSRHGINGDPVDRLPPCKWDEEEDEYPNQCGPYGWDYPTKPHPKYLNAADSYDAVPPGLFVTGASTEFEMNDPGIPLGLALLNDTEHRGNLYWARDASDTGNFGWLSWDGSTDTPTLRDSVTPPGDFEEKYPGSPADTNTTGDPPENVPGCEADGGTSDTGDCDNWLEKGEWADNGPGNMNAQQVTNYLDDYIDDRTHVNILVFDQVNTEIDDVNGGGENLLYRAFDFITVRLVGYSFGGNDSEKWILFEFISRGINCGPQAVSPYPYP
jgi:hypothetical protein